MGEIEANAEETSSELVVHRVALDDLEIDEDLLITLPPLANIIIDAAIDNMTRKLVAGYRNKNVAKPNAKKLNVGAETKEALKAVSAQSAMDVANRGQAWKELIVKSFTAGISSISTIKFDGQFSIKDGRPNDGFNGLPDSPGVYVVFNNQDRPVYVGDSGDMKKRWYAGHLNEFRQGERNNDPYKLSSEFSEGCTVKFIKMESVETAAALEARLIKENFDKFQGVPKNPKKLTEEQARQREEAIEDDGMLKNRREELATEQGKRSNIEAKKMKDSSGSTARLVMGAVGEAFKNVGYDLIERLTATTIKAIKDELVDIFHPQGKPSKIVIRVRRILKKILAVLQGLFEKPLQLARGIVQFIVNALSRTIGQIYNLAGNIFDLANNAWGLYKGAETMPREELVRKISETVIVSGSLVIWDALDAMLEKWITAQSAGALAPFAPYISAAVTAIGFGLSSYALQTIVTRIIDAVVAFKQGIIETMESAREACNELIRNAERELELMSDLRDYLASSLDLMGKLQAHTATLSEHQAIESLSSSFLILPRR